MQSPDNCESDIVDLSQVFTLFFVLKDLSTVHVVTGNVNAINMAWRIEGNSSVSFNKLSSPSGVVDFSCNLLDHSSDLVAASALKLSIS